MHADIPVMIVVLSLLCCMTLSMYANLPVLIVVLSLLCCMTLSIYADLPVLIVVLSLLCCMTLSMYANLPLVIVVLSLLCCMTLSMYANLPLMIVAAPQLSIVSTCLGRPPQERQPTGNYRCGSPYHPRTPPSDPVVAYYLPVYLYRFIQSILVVCLFSCLLHYTCT